MNDDGYVSLKSQPGLKRKFLVEKNQQIVSDKKTKLNECFNENLNNNENENYGTDNSEISNSYIDSSKIDDSEKESDEELKKDNYENLNKFTKHILLKIERKCSNTLSIMQQTLTKMNMNNSTSNIREASSLDENFNPGKIGISFNNDYSTLYIDVVNKLLEKEGLDPIYNYRIEPFRTGQRRSHDGKILPTLPLLPEKINKEAKLYVDYIMKNNK